METYLKKENFRLRAQDSLISFPVPVFWFICCHDKGLEKYNVRRLKEVTTRNGKYIQRLFFFFLNYFIILRCWGIEPRALHMSGKRSTSKLYPHPQYICFEWYYR